MSNVHKSPWWGAPVNFSQCDAGQHGKRSSGDDCLDVLCCAGSDPVYDCRGNPHYERRRGGRSFIRPVSRLLIVTGMVILMVPLFGRYLNTLALLGVISVILFVPVFVGIRSWVKYKFFGAG